MTFRLLLLAALFLCTITTFAQIQSESGKLVLTNGRELTGKITHFYDTPSEVIFHDAEDNRQTFLTAEVSEIILSGHRRFVVRKLNSAPLVFQEIIASDVINFYKRESALTELYLAKNGEVYRLENNSENVTENGKTYKKYDYQYVRILTTLMQDRSDLVEKIQKAKLDEQSLTAIVMAYTNGNITYYYPSDSKIQNDPYWAVYAHYSNHKMKELTTGSSYGYQVGVQYYFASAKRSSIRVGLDYATYEMGNDTYIAALTAIKYQFDFIKKEKMNFYFTANMLEFGYAKHKNSEKGTGSSGFGVKLPLSPGLGFEYRNSDKLSLFAELNNLFIVKNIPNNYSLGLRYTFSK